MRFLPSSCLQDQSVRPVINARFQHNDDWDPLHKPSIDCVLRTAVFFILVGIWSWLLLNPWVNKAYFLNWWRCVWQPEIASSLTQVILSSYLYAVVIWTFLGHDLLRLEQSSVWLGCACAPDVALIDVFDAMRIWYVAWTDLAKPRAKKTPHPLKKRIHTTFWYSWKWRLVLP